MIPSSPHWFQAKPVISTALWRLACRINPTNITWMHHETATAALFFGGLPLQSEYFRGSGNFVYVPTGHFQADKAVGRRAGRAAVCTARQTHCGGYAAGAGRAGNYRAYLSRRAEHPQYRHGVCRTGQRPLNHCHHLHSGAACAAAGGGRIFPTVSESGLVASAGRAFSGR